MAGTPDSTSPEVVCPHCKKAFTAELLGENAGRSRGFKCPHCRLFVASDRAEPEAAERPGESRGGVGGRR